MYNIILEEGFSSKEYHEYRNKEFNLKFEAIEFVRKNLFDSVFRIEEDNFDRCVIIGQNKKGYSASVAIIEKKEIKEEKIIVDGFKKVERIEFIYFVADIPNFFSMEKQGIKSYFNQNKELIAYVDVSEQDYYILDKIKKGK